MEVYHNTRVIDKNISPQIMAAAYPHINQEQINDLLQAAKEGLLAFSVTIDLNVVKTMRILKRSNKDLIKSRHKN